MRGLSAARRAAGGVALAAMACSQSGVPAARARSAADTAATRTPIKHVLYIIGENRSFDHVFGTFTPSRGQAVRNLLSEGIVDVDGRPGANFARAQQWQASGAGAYSIHPKRTSPYPSLPPPNTDSAPTRPYFSSLAKAEAVEPALPAEAYDLLTTGGTGLPKHVTDTRFPELQSGPFAITNWISYNDYAGNPAHRFFQMWQQMDCARAAATPANPSGCRMDLFPWVEVSVGAGSNGKPPPSGFDPNNKADYEVTKEGAIAMGFYNNDRGDVSYLGRLAREYALNDNYHQAVAGGTGANHIILGYGTLIYYANPDGSPGTPPPNQIENPNPMPGFNNWYTQDGYRGGSYVNCSDPAQPGVASILNYLKSLPYKPFRGGNCARGAYYLVNNYNPGYRGDGTPAPLGANQYTIPPSRQDNLGLLLTAHHISWRYYGEGWNGGREKGEAGTYCNVCNPFLYSVQIMTNPALRANLKGIRDLYSDIANGTLPAVSIVKPDGVLDGHPASSKFNLFEEFCRKIVDKVRRNPSLWKATAIMITTDEGGGYYDSGYVQPIDFFGDGTRIPLIVVSPYSAGVGVVHSYGDHVSFDKFVERNWNLPPIGDDTRDTLPNPIANGANPYAPTNAPALSDLMTMFDFPIRAGGGKAR
ncbi:MAG TPA: alkaline phosphatase family protein [Stellaceae bacterium]|nr:alkaline phosphatase family protein [Stellaceae bacterium]